MREVPPGAGPVEQAREAGSLWRPLRTPIFRNLFVAELLSDMGTFMQGVAAAWLMVSPWRHHQGGEEAR
jgi:Transmembrane secretion effector